MGKTIKIYLMDNDASGRWSADLDNWNGKAYKIPHTDLNECSDLKGINGPGVYFLFGKDDGEDKPFIYIGEADNVIKRLSQLHTFESNGESYWTEAVIFITNDGYLEKGRVKYLENRFHSLAVEANRYIVKNGNTPTQSNLDISVKDSLETFIENAKLVLSALRYTAFEPSPSNEKEDIKQDEELLYLRRNNGEGGKGIGKITTEGFWVLKGSYIYPEIASYVNSGIKKARKKYASKIKKGILQEDICFGSPSGAAEFVFGKSSNGLIEWKNKDGISLKNLDDVRENKQDNLYHLASKNVKAYGIAKGKQFIVCKDSDFSEDETKSCHSYVRKIRQKLLKEGKVKDYKFVEDVEFDSPSTAASVVLGRSCNGLITWKDENNQRLKDKTK